MKLGLVVIDYLQLVSFRGQKKTRKEQITKIIVDFKALSRELSIPITLLSQVRRDVEQREDKRPCISDSHPMPAFSYADIILLLYRPCYYLKRSPPSQQDNETYSNFEKRRQDWLKKCTELHNRTELNIARHPSLLLGIIHFYFNKEIS